ncbi:hypothetical protein GHN86_22590, partial [Pseudomonas helleri]|nr:hypothetical protein [Pseudomonas helleri]
MNAQLWLKTSTALLLVMTVSLAGCSSGGGGSKSHVSESTPEAGTDGGTGGTDAGAGGGDGTG